MLAVRAAAEDRSRPQKRREGVLQRTIVFDQTIYVIKIA